MVPRNSMWACWNPQPTTAADGFVGMYVPASLRRPSLRAQRRRLRSVRLELLVKAKYKGLDSIRDQAGEEAAVEEFYRRRRGAR